MPITTIKVDTGVRDQLAALARAQGKTMGGLLSDVADRLTREQRDQEIAAAYARIQRVDPAGWQEYLEELEVWQRGTAAADSTAAEEWPEYNERPSPAQPPSR